MTHPRLRRLTRRHPSIVRYQAQGVLRRATRKAPLLLVGVTLDSTFFPRTPVDGTVALTLTKGLVALTPLTAVDAVGPREAAPVAMAEANADWEGEHGPRGGDPDPQ